MPSWSCRWCIADNTKVINLTNSSAKGITWKVNAASAGVYTLKWRYTNGGSGNATTAKLIVNGVTINSALSFPKTSGSTVFSTVTVTANLASGNNSIRLETTVSSAFADIDWIEITGDNPVAANCAAPRPLVVTFGESKNTNAPGLFPNPTTGKVTICFTLPCNDNVTIKIYNSDGLLIDDLGTKPFAAGYQQVVYYLHGRKTSWYNVLVKAEKGMEKVLQLFVQ